MTRHGVIRIVVFFTLLAIFALFPFQITIGARTYGRHLSYSQNNPTRHPNLYDHIELDGPTGSFESFEGYTVRVGKLVVQFDIVTDHLKERGL